MSEYNNNYERELALMEAAMIDALDAFFSARPHFQRTSGTHNCTERLFEAAFQRGWDAKSNELNRCEKVTTNAELNSAAIEKSVLSASALNVVLGK